MKQRDDEFQKQIMINRVIKITNLGPHFDQPIVAPNK